MKKDRNVLIQPKPWNLDRSAKTEICVWPTYLKCIVCNIRNGKGVVLHFHFSKESTIVRKTSDGGKVNNKRKVVKSTLVSNIKTKDSILF